MLDESIISSPSKYNISIRETRLKRKSKRNNVDLSLVLNSDHDNNGVGFNGLINKFYKDSSDENADDDNKSRTSTTLVGNPSAIIRNYKPFQLEQSLVMADHIFAQEIKQNNSNVVQNTPGFTVCSNINEANLNIKYFKSTSEENDNNSFIITESELITCCDQAEKILQNAASNGKYNGLEYDLTPDKNENMTLVNSILEDFSQSPLGRAQIIENTSWQYTPEFRLRRRPVKNYSRKFLNSTKTNLNQTFEEHATKDSSNYDDDQSSSSSLSIQEDVTFVEHLNEHPAVTNASNTQRLCENLLNLTEYYTQNESHQSFSDCQQVQQESTNSQEIGTLLGNLPDLINDILAFRLMHPNKIRYDSYNSIDDFHGFHNKEYVLDSDNDDVQFTNSHTMHDLNACDIRRSDNSINEKDTKRLKDWNEDGYHDIFACINTENIILEDNMHLLNNEAPNTTEHFITNSISKISIENPSTLNSASFKTASSKPIKVSKEAQMMVDRILSKLPDLPAFKEDIPLNCSEEANIFEDPEDYEWNDDCDLFLNFQTPIALNENSETKSHESLRDSPQEKNGPSACKKEIRKLKADGGNIVHMSQKDKNIAQKTLKELSYDFKSDVSYEDELRNMKLIVYTKNHNLQPGPSFLSVSKQINRGGDINKTCDKHKGIDEDKNSYINSTFNENTTISSGSIANEEACNDKNNILSTNVGFQTANGKKVVISKRAKQSVEKILQEFETISNYENDIKELKMKIQTRNKDLNSKSVLQDHECDKTLVNKYHARADVCHNLYSIPETIISKRKTIDNTDLESQNERHLEKKFKNGFHTSQSSHQFSEYAIKDAQQELDVRSTSLKEYPKTKRYQEQSLKDGPITCKKEILGFKTASGRNLPISETAQNTVKTIFEPFTYVFKNDGNCEEELRVMKFKVYAKTHDLQLNRDQINEENDARDEVSPKSDTNGGSNFLNTKIEFQTANVKKLDISQNAKQTFGKLMQKFETISDIPNYENDIKELKAGIQTKNENLKSKSVQESNEYSKKLRLIQKTMNGKRKNSTGNSDLESPSKTLPVKLFKNAARTSRSLFAEQSLKSPLSSAAHSLVLRKNLSLTKKRKRKLLSLPTEEISEMDTDICDLKVNTATPIKSCISLKAPEQNLSTPNLKEFLSNSPLTSTPIISKPGKSLSIIEDSDLKPITWNNNNDSISNKSTNNSMRTTNLSESSSSNFTLNSSNPTAKERIGRLKMYGKAPDVSPILMENNHNCRPSGLRRTRSMIKKN